MLLVLLLPRCCCYFFWLLLAAAIDSTASTVSTPLSQMSSPSIPSTSSSAARAKISLDTHGGHHGDTSVLQLHGSAALECRDIAIGGKSDGVPEAHWRLHPELALEGTQGRGSVVGPVTPGAASQAILCEISASNY